MFTIQRKNWNLLAKSLAGETGEAENKAMEGWLEKKPENGALYKQLKSYWKIMDSMDKQFNVDNAWNKLQDRIVAHGDPAGQNYIYPQAIRFSAIRIAATLLLLTALGILLVYITGNFREVTRVSGLAERLKSIELPDGSKVFMNADTRISYPQKFRNKSREVKLTGEAFFEVSPDRNKPFIIHAGKADIQVVGTSFNVDTRIGKQAVEVYVSTGIVELCEAENKVNRVVLHPGELGSVTLNKVQSMKCENENPIAWKTGVMDFRDTRLSEAVRILSEIYLVDIVCQEPGLDTSQTNGTYRYPEESLDEILTILCKQNHLKFEKSDNKIYLSR